MIYQLTIRLMMILLVNNKINDNIKWPYKNKTYKCNCGYETIDKSNFRKHIKTPRHDRFGKYGTT